MNDAINPKHYKFPNGIQSWDIGKYLTPAGQNVVKYVSRATRLDGEIKGNPLEDLKKAQWYLEEAIREYELSRER